MRAVDTLGQLQHFNNSELRVWVRQFLQYGIASPNCPGTQEQPSYLRLLGLCSPMEASDAGSQVLRERIRQEAWSLAGLYEPGTDGGHLGLEILRFATETYAISAILPFNQILMSRLLDPKDPPQLMLWLEAHWSVPRVLGGWQFVEGWVRRDAIECEENGDAVPPMVRQSAIGIWARYGPTNTLLELIKEAVLPLVKSGRATNGTDYIELLDHARIACRRNTEDPHAEPLNSLGLSMQPLPNTDSGGDVVDVSEVIFMRELAREITRGINPSSISETMAAVRRFHPDYSAGDQWRSRP